MKDKKILLDINPIYKIEFLKDYKNFITFKKGDKMYMDIKTADLLYSKGVIKLLSLASLADEKEKF